MPHARTLIYQVYIFCLLPDLPDLPVLRLVCLCTIGQFVCTLLLVKMFAREHRQATSRTNHLEKDHTYQKLKLQRKSTFKKTRSCNRTEF